MTGEFCVIDTYDAQLDVHSRELLLKQLCSLNNARYWCSHHIIYDTYHEMLVFIIIMIISVNVVLQFLTVTTRQHWIVMLVSFTCVKIKQHKTGRSHIYIITYNWSNVFMSQIIKWIQHRQTLNGCKHLFKAMAVAGIIQTKNVLKFPAIQNV